MRALLSAAAAMAALAAAAPAAAEGWYAQGNVGVSIGGDADLDLTYDDGFEEISASGEVDLDTGAIVTGSFGTRLEAGPRVEAEMIWSGNDIDEEGLEDFNVSQVAVLGNVLFDFNRDDAFSPYIGAGVGFGRTFIDIEDIGEEDDTGVAWQLRVGATYTQSETLVWDIGYRYLTLAPFEWSGSSGSESASIDVDASIHAITVGLRFGG